MYSELQFGCLVHNFLSCILALELLCLLEIYFSLEKFEVRLVFTPLVTTLDNFSLAFAELCSYTQILQVEMQLSLTFIKSITYIPDFPCYFGIMPNSRKQKYNFTLSLLSQEVSVLQCCPGLLSQVIKVGYKYVHIYIYLFIPHFF